jgi:hypothetical protein
MQKTSKHLDSDKKATVASGERKSGHTMDGIVTGLPKRVSPVIVDGIVRGIARHTPIGVKADTSNVIASATPKGRGTFGSGAFPEGHM